MLAELPPRVGTTLQGSQDHCRSLEAQRALLLWMRRALVCVAGGRGEEGPPAGADVVVRVHADDSKLQFQGWLCRSPPTSGGKRHVRRSRGGLEMERAGPALKTPPRDHQQFFSWKQGRFNHRDLAAGSWSHGRCQEVLRQNILFFFLFEKTNY